VPKTLIFAKDDSHADDIVRQVREVFDKSNDFCVKITSKSTGASSDELLKRFRNDFNPRIAVTVDLIATGTDVKSIECVFFMRAVKNQADCVAGSARNPHWSSPLAVPRWATSLGESRGGCCVDARGSGRVLQYAESSRGGLPTGNRKTGGPVRGVTPVSSIRLRLLQGDSRTTPVAVP
jgi:hypothetical protein